MTCEWRYSSMHSNPRQFTAIMIKSGRLRSNKNIWYPFHMRLSGLQSQIGCDDEEKNPLPSQESNPCIV